MTIKEAIEVLEQDLFSEYCMDLKEALTIAIKSLEAWEKVKKEIGDLYFYWCEINPSSVTKKCLEIIDKHLAEVEG